MMTPDDVRKVRAELGLSVAEFALLLGVDIKQVQWWETGHKRGRPFVCNGTGEAAIRYGVLAFLMCRHFAVSETLTPRDRAYGLLLEALPERLREKV